VTARNNSENSKACKKEPKMDNWNKWELRVERLENERQWRGKNKSRQTRGTDEEKLQVKKQRVYETMSQRVLELPSVGIRKHARQEGEDRSQALSTSLEGQQQQNSGKNQIPYSVYQPPQYFRTLVALSAEYEPESEIEG